MMTSRNAKSRVSGFAWQRAVLRVGAGLIGSRPGTTKSVWLAAPVRLDLDADVFEAFVRGRRHPEVLAEGILLGKCDRGLNALLGELVGSGARRCEHKGHATGEHCPPDFLAVQPPVHRVEVALDGGKELL